MAPLISDVQFAVTGSVAAPVVMPLLNAQPGDWILVVAASPVGGGTGITGTPGEPSDDHFNRYAVIARNARGDVVVSVFLAQAVYAGPGVTITCLPNTQHVVHIAWAIRNGAFNWDRLFNTGTTNPVQVGPSAAAPANSLMIAFAAIASTAVLGEQAGWNAVGVNGFTSAMSANAKVGQYGVSNDLWSMYNIVTGAQTPAWPGTAGGQDWVAFCASFSTPVPPPFPLHQSLDLKKPPNVAYTFGFTVQPVLNVLVDRTIVLEPRNVGVSSGGETSVVF